jgi:hypothetical protein
MVNGYPGPCFLITEEVKQRSMSMNGRPIRPILGNLSKVQ